ncbi:MAG: ISL3 family transposase [Chloroflexota bacterium]
MLKNCIPFELPGFRISSVENTDDRLIISAAAKSCRARCPDCQVMSRAIHSHYLRSPRDLPVSGKRVRLVLAVRRFRCRNAACSRTIFCERLPRVVAVSAQQSVRLATALEKLSLALGGQAGARQSAWLGIPTSPSTLLRSLRRYEVPALPTPRVLGVDDFALRRGRVYGTLLVDGETHRPVDLIRERTAEALCTWLQAHPGVEVITRDRSTEYSRGATLGAPTARQVADRRHLLVNLREALERVLDRLRTEIQASLLRTPTQALVSSMTIYDRERRRGTQDQTKQQASRARRYALYAQVKALQTQGRAILQIARELNISRQTVRKYMASDLFPDYPHTKRQKSMLDPYVTYLQQRWNAGCHNTQQLWRELQSQGFSGSSRSVWQWAALRRPPLPAQLGRPPARPVEVFTPPTPQLTPASLPASRRLVWFLLLPSSELDEQQQHLRAHLRQLPQIQQAFALAHQFLAMVRQRMPTVLAPWIEACRSSGIAELKSFAEGLLRDFPIIHAALELPYSNGLTEGHVNRLKTIKRMMYGRASFDVLRRRVLAAA